MVAWGYNYDGQCDVPVPNSGFDAIAAGLWHSLGLKSDGSVVAWGHNAYGQCDVPSPNSGFVAVAAGQYHSLGVRSDGTIVAWGSNSNGQCNMPSPNSGFVAVAAGGYCSLGLKSVGSVVEWPWPKNVPPPNSGFVGLGGTLWGVRSDGSLATWGGGTPPSPNTGFVAISVLSHFLGAISDGTVVAMGSNAFGECDVPSPNTGFVAVSAGDGHSLGLKSDGSVVAWGRNDYRQCDVPSPNSGFAAVAAGWGHSLGLKSSGSVVAWGRNNHGECDVPYPNFGFVAVSAGGGHSLGLKSNGSVVAWGDNYSGQCDVPLPNSGFVAICAGSDHSLGLKCDGSVVAWGTNPGGGYNAPPPNSGFVAIATCGTDCLGLKSDAPVPSSLQLASLRLVIQPEEAVAEGGLWRRAGTTAWLESGDTETGLPSGVYRIEFKDVPTWVKLDQLAYLSPLGFDAPVQGYRPYRPSEAKCISPDTPIRVTEAVSAAWEDVFYLEAANRISGIRVEKPGHGLTAGVAATVVGAVKTNPSGERYIEPTSVSGGTTAAVAPIGMLARSVGGGSFFDLATGIGQQGIAGAVGLNNIGLLVRIWGKVTEIDTVGPATWFKIDDGSGVCVKCVIPDGVTIDPGWQFVGVTGVSSCEKVGEELHRLLRVRQQSDIMPY